MNNLVSQFENLITLKAIMDDIDLNFIDTGDLENIVNCAIDLDIDIEDYDIDDIYNSEYDRIYDIYIEWFEDVNFMYLDVKNELLKIIGEWYYA